MIRLSAILWCFSFVSPAWGQDQAFWGGTGCAIAAIEGQAHVAEVTCQNRVTGGDYHNEAVIEAGLAVVILVDHGPGHQPDTFTVIPPEGYSAVPQFVTLAENDGAVILIFPYVGS